MVNLLRDCDLEVVIAGFPDGVGSVWISEVTKYEKILIDEVKELDFGDKLVSFHVEIEVIASIDIDWIDYIKHSEVRDYFGEDEERFSSLWTYSSERVTAYIDLIFNLESGEIQSEEVRLVEGPYGSLEYDGW